MPAHQRSDAEEGASARRDHLPAARPAEEERSPVPEHGGGARDDAGQVPVDEGRGERRREALERVDGDDREPVAASEDAPDVRPADVAAAERPDVDALRRADEPVAGRDRAGQVADQREECGGHRKAISLLRRDLVLRDPVVRRGGTHGSPTSPLLLASLVDHFVEIWYLEIQSLTVPQSRLSKNASM
jgi:hypothetical protein